MCGCFWWCATIFGVVLYCDFLYRPLSRQTVCVLGSVGCSVCEMRLFSVFFCREKSYKVALRQPTAEVKYLPETEAVAFKTRLQKGSRIQVPKSLRQHCNLKSTQVLKVSVYIPEAHTNWETFYAHIDKSGRITIPKLTLNQLQTETSAETSTGFIFEVEIEVKM